MHAVTLTSETSEESPAILGCATVPAHDPEGLTVYKTDADTGESLAQGNADLSGAQFTVGYYAGYYDGEELPESPDRVWVVETKHNEAEGVYEAQLTDGYKVSGDGLYLYGGSEALPLGTYTLQETLAPEGYLQEGAPVVSENWVSEHTYEAPVHVGYVTLDENEVQSLAFSDDEEESGDAGLAEETGENAESTDTEPEEDTQIIDAGENGENGGEAGEEEAGEALPGTNRYTAEENVKRFDFILETQDDGTHDDTGYTEFEITSLTTGESHRFLTDASGEYVSVASTNPHTYDTDNATDQHSGLWFYGTADAGTQEAETVVDSEGALPYDIYSVNEIAGAYNSGRDLYHAVFGFTDDDYAGSVYVLTASDGYTETEEDEEPDDSAAETAATDAGDSGTDGADGSTGTADTDSSSAESADSSASGGSEGGSEPESGTPTVQTGACDAGAAAGLAGAIALAAAVMLARRRRKAA